MESEFLYKSLFLLIIEKKCASGNLNSSQFGSACGGFMNDENMLLDMENAIERMGDASIYHEIVQLFAQRVELMLAEIQSSLDACDMQAAMRYAHSLKGNCATIGAESLRKKCLELEMACKNEDAQKGRDVFKEIRPELLRLKMFLMDL